MAEQQDQVGERSMALVAHVLRELRRPLAANRTVVSSLLTGDVGRLTKNQRHYLQQAEATNVVSLRLAEVGGLLMQLTTGKLHLRCTSTPLAIIIRSISGSGAAIDGSSNMNVMVDKTQMSYALMSLANYLVDMANTTPVVVRWRRSEPWAVVTFQIATRISREHRRRLYKLLRAQVPANFTDEPLAVELMLASLLLRMQAVEIEIDRHLRSGLILRLRLPLANQLSLL